MKVMFSISSMGSGGAERVVSLLANSWAKRGWQVSIVTLSSQASFYSLDPAITLYTSSLMEESGSLWDSVCNTLRRILVIRHFVGDYAPDVLISFVDVTNVRTLLATRFLGLPVIISERTDPRMHSIGRLWSTLRRLTYPWADSLVVQSETVKAYFPPGMRAITSVIPNPVPVLDCHERCDHPLGAPGTIVAMGRLSPEKGFDLLLRAFSRTREMFPEWRLKILGEGAERTHLETLIAELGLRDRAELAGLVAHPAEVLSQADLFVLSSRYEGFPNALCEAMACGLPVVSFDCPSGPREIIRHEVDGMLVPPEDVDALFDAMVLLMSQPALRRRFGEAARSITGRFGVESVLAQWDKLIEEVIDRKPQA